MHITLPSRSRHGGVYIAVLGTSLIVSVLGLTTLLVHRIQNRQLEAANDIRQAQLNAETAAELALLTIKQDTTWRTTRANGAWFTDRATGAGTCSLEVTDPADQNLADDAQEPIAILGIGKSGRAEQRIALAVDPRKEPLSCLRSAAAVGDLIDLASDTLRANGLISANTVTANASFVYGDVQAVAISGSTYNGTSTQITAAQRPTMPNWQTVFNYYRTNGTRVHSTDIDALPDKTPNLGRNVSFDTTTNYWTGAATGLPTANITRETGIGGHSASGRVRDRTANTAGGSQYIDHFVKSGANYNITLQVYPNSSWGNAFRVKLATKGSGAVQTSTSAVAVLASDAWHDVIVTLAAPAWSGELEYARVTIDTDHAFGSTNTFYIDNLDIREAVTGRFIYRQLLSPSSNPFGGGTNSQGIYWIDCKGQRLIIERSRILGTLLLINPGANSCVADGPIHWSPAVAGYPALLVDADTATDADFSIRATNRGLSETDDATNYNPSGSAHSDLGFDADTNDIYQSRIEGLIAVEDDLVFENAPLIRGQVIVGDDIAASSGTLEVDYRADSLLQPPPGFSAPDRYVPRPGSAKKAIVP